MRKKLLVFAIILGLILACSKDDGPAQNPKTEVQKSSAKEISGFSFRAADNGVLENDVIGTIDQQAKTINLTVPSATDVSTLLPEITISNKATINPTGAGNFKDMVSYTVTAEDGTLTEYDVIVTVAASSEKQILSFRFLNIEIDGVAVDISGEIDTENKTITATLPTGTDVTALEPKVEISAEAILDPIGPQDFTNPINYTITAGNGTSDTYSVIVTVQLSQKEILLLILEVNPGNTLGWDKDKNISEFDGVEFDGDGKVISLNLGEKNLYSVPSEIGLLSSLEYLILGFNKLKTLPPEIGQLSGLEVLNLQNNELEALPFEIGQLNRLQYLYASVNILEALPPEVGQLMGLKILTLQNNNLKALPKEIGQLSSLGTLNLQDNELEALPPEIGQLSNLQVLQLDSNNLQSLPSEIGQLYNLIHLNLSGNLFKTLPREINQLSNLKVLSLKENDFVNLPAEVWQLSNLTNLDLSRNNLEAVSSKIGQLSNLRNLDLSRNNLETLPSEIGQLSNLTIMGLRNNHLSTLSRTIANLENLEYLLLIGNPGIKFLHNDICDLELGESGTVEIDIIPSDEVECVGDEIGS